MRAPPSQPHLNLITPKAPRPNAITLGIRASTYGFGVATNIQSKANGKTKGRASLEDGCENFVIWSEHAQFEVLSDIQGDMGFFFLLFVHFLFIYFWLHCVCVAVGRLSPGAMSGVFSLRWLLLLGTIGSSCTGVSSCSTWAQWLWHTGLVAPRHVKSFWTRDQTHVPCTGRQILNHWTTRKVPFSFGVMKTFWKLIEVVTAQHCEYTNCQNCTLQIGCFDVMWI